MNARIVVIGAGVGGLTTAAVLARAGYDVPVLEAHVYTGGCAGTFYHRGYRFDAGATLAGGFYPGGPMDRVASQAGIGSWPAREVQAAMVVHLPHEQPITRWGDDRRWPERWQAFGVEGERFWRWQEKTADALWQLALASPPWPPVNSSEAVHLAGLGLRWLGRDRYHRHPGLLADGFRKMASHLDSAPPALRLFVDAQLLISAQTTSAHANALYGASALDLPRRGVVHLRGGMGAIAATLAEAVRRHGGRVHLRQEVTGIRFAQGRPVAVVTKRKQEFAADLVVANLPPWNITQLVGDQRSSKLRQLPIMPADGWGAFMVYVGFDQAILTEDAPLHHQVVVRQPLAEGNTIFLSLSPGWDPDRAPAGKRALTISTHTALAPWWQLRREDPGAYERRRQTYVDGVLTAAGTAIPGLRAAADLILPGTPVTFQRFTRRQWGWVGGFPQTNLFRTWSPRLQPGLWMVGDSIFPGQSTAAVALGGLRVAAGVARELGDELPDFLRDDTNGTSTYDHNSNLVDTA